MSIPVQGQFRIRIYNGKKVQPDYTMRRAGVYAASDDYIDIERCVELPVTYEEQASLLNTLTFTINRFADVLLYYFYIGQKIIFYGGRYNEDSKSLRHVFSGTVTRIRTKFDDTGKVTITVEAMNYGFTKMGKNTYSYVYPDEASTRTFARAESLSLEDIVRGIAADNKFAIGRMELSSEARAERFTKTNIRYQRDMTDWEFLQHLAEDYGCRCWMTSDEGADVLNFCSDGKASQSQSDISFLYPLKSNKMHKDILPTEIQTFGSAQYNRPRILRDVNVDEDISQAYAVSRTSLYYDKTTGEYKDAISKIETDKDGKRYITFYELDEERVKYIHEHEPAIAEKIRNGSPTDLPWGDPNDPNSASYYYKATKVYDENVAVFDRAFFGITVTAKCLLDLDIRSQRSYKIRGILSYHSKDNLETAFFLRGLKHVWASDGIWTELDFIR